MKIIFFIFLCIGILYSCKKETAGTAAYGMSIRYVDSNNNDLYAIAGTNGYWQDSIKVYDITGKKMPLINCFGDQITNFQFRQLDFLVINLCENTDIVNRYSYTLIHLKYGVEDTIKCHIDHDNLGLYTSNDKIWYNGVLLPYINGYVVVMKK